MDTFATRYAYKMGKKSSSTRKKSLKRIQTTPEAKLLLSSVVGLRRSPDQNVVMVIADDFQDPSPTEEMINKRHSKNNVDNNINTLKKEIMKLEMMTDGQGAESLQQLNLQSALRSKDFGQDHSNDIDFLKNQIKRLEKRSPKSSKKGGQGSKRAQQLTTKSFGKKRTLRKFRNC